MVPVQLSIIAMHVFANTNNVTYVYYNEIFESWFGLKNCLF